MPKRFTTKARRFYQCVGINPEKLQQPVLPGLGSRPFLLVVAQHRKNKNLALLFSAFAELRRRDARYHEWSLVIVGGIGPETPYLHRLVQRLSLQRYLVFSSGVSDEQLCWLYENCVACVAPSSIEGFGLPVLEALACGSRVVCSDIPTFREIGSSTCEYFSLACASPAMALADAIRNATRAPAPRAVNLDRFSSRQIATEFVTAYSKLISDAKVANQATAASASNEPVPYDSLAS